MQTSEHISWETVIGLEVHVQLQTLSKIFCGSATAYGAEPNTQTCEVDLAFPGTLPVLNQKAVDLALAFGCAIGAEIAPFSVFSRKHYFYPDLPKGYQISQYDKPIVGKGKLRIFFEGAYQDILIERAHLEEDAGKSLHHYYQNQSGIDLNRAGTPLLEIVSAPVMRSAAQAVTYLKTLHNLVVYLGICDGNMQEGSFRCDANVSVRPVGSTTFGTRCEIKNVNSFRFVEKAILYESARQIALLEQGQKVVQQTRLYDPDRNETRALRDKEEANDYRYFPDPDLLPVYIRPEDLARVRAQLPELPAEKQARFEREYQLSAYDASVLTAQKALALYYEEIIQLQGGLFNVEQMKIMANWVMGDLLGALNKEGLDIEQSPIEPAQMRFLGQKLFDGTLSSKTAKSLFEAFWNKEEGGDGERIIEKRGLKQLNDESALEKMILATLEEFPQQCADFRAGKEKLLGFFVGQLMKKSQGSANPDSLNRLLLKHLKGT